MGDEILRWMFGNVVLRRDPAGNIKPDKEKSVNKIDGVVALIMAKGEQMTAEPMGSIYDDTESEL
jgi:phage terminase large subunit-like protein